MTMKNGLYSVQFGVNGNVGSGTIYYEDGVVKGGDAGFLYDGFVTQDGDRVHGKVDVVQHTPGFDNVFAGLTNFTLNVEGTQMSADTAGFNGTTSAAPGQNLKVSMQFRR